jgi:hypothetical protein
VNGCASASGYQWEKTGGGLFHAYKGSAGPCQYIAEWSVPECPRVLKRFPGYTGDGSLPDLRLVSWIPKFIDLIYLHYK